MTRTDAAPCKSCGSGEASSTGLTHACEGVIKSLRSVSVSAPEKFMAILGGGSSNWEVVVG